MIDRRQFTRHSLGMKIKLEEIGSERTVTTVTRDVSFGGISILHKKSYTVGQTVKLSIAASKKVFRIKGRISYCYSQSSWNRFKIGIAFAHPSSQFIFKMAEELTCIEKYHKSLERKLGRSITEHEAAQKWIKENARKFADLFDSYQADRRSEL